MSLFEQRYFSLGTSPKSMFFEHISDGLRVDRIRENIVDEFGDLNSSIKLASSDLSYNNLLITWSKLGRTASRMVFFVQLQLFTNSPNSRLP
jgi:hypothetical protein